MCSLYEYHWGKLRGFTYFLMNIITFNARWIRILVGLRQFVWLNLKVTCKALLSIFMRDGIPNVIASDNRVNFNLALTQEYERRIGSSPRFSKLSYSLPNELVEWLNTCFITLFEKSLKSDIQKCHSFYVLTEKPQKVLLVLHLFNYYRDRS